MLRAITHLGDSALLIPATLVVAGYLFWSRLPRLAFAWLAAIFGCMAATLGAKILFYIVSCGVREDQFSLLSPSGHTSFSFAFYGGLGLLLANARPLWQQRLIIGGSLGIALLIGLTRVLIRVHSPVEVAAGFLIGGTALGLFAWFNARLGRPDVRALPLLVTVALTAAALHGLLLNAEPRIRFLAKWLSLSIGVCS